jgi:predicted secreted Zn-dependent protease
MAAPNLLKLQVIAVFNCTQSCTKTDTSYYLLNHERNHFNISEIIARRLRHDLLCLHTDQAHATAGITRIYNQHIAALEKLQNAYDSDTQHSIRRNRQAVWDAWVNEQLQALNNYASTEVIIHMAN